jgi:RNA polymerase sigma-70 factor (ECF subfamily)
MPGNNGQMENNTAISLYNDEELMLFIKQGSVPAFDELYARYSKRLFAYFFRMLNYEREKAEDALQDLFMKIAESPEKFDCGRSFKTWVFSVACNYCKNFYRHHQVVQQSEAYLICNQQQNDEAYLLFASGIDVIEFTKSLEAALMRLSPEKREAFILKYQEEKTIAEIAFIQNCPEGSVKSRLHYTLQFLEEKLKIFKPVN